VRFVKMHGCGNDYLFLDAIARPELAERDDVGELARRMCDRHAGVGADGVIVLSRAPPPTDADASMRIVNSDGSDGGMCGNGVRCAAKLLVEGHGAPGAGGLRIAIADRVVHVHASAGPGGRIEEASVDMGEVSFGIDAVGGRADLLEQQPGGVVRVGEEELGLLWLGNPHAVALTGLPVEGVDLASRGGAIERHGAFPQRINFHVAALLSPEEVRMRSWERGVGETMACGSGACAVVAEGVRRGLLHSPVRVGVAGGELRVEIAARGHAVLTGPAARVFEGEWPD